MTKKFSEHRLDFIMNTKKFIVFAALVGMVFAFRVVHAQEVPDVSTPTMKDLWAIIQDLQKTLSDLQAKATMVPNATTIDSNNSNSNSSQNNLIGFTYRKDMSFERIGTTNFTAVPDRTVWYEKHQDKSILKVTYDDSFGVTYKEKGDCQWRLTLDGNAKGREKSFAPSASGSNLLTDRTSSSVSWIIDDVRKGFYNFTIEAKRSMTNAFTTRCDNGWQDGNQENSLTVEEISK